MKVLLVGGGGREHSLGWKISQSPLLTKLYLAPGNPGLNALGEPLGISAEDIDGIVDAAQSRKVDLVVVGPETPLAKGLADRLTGAGIPCFGPSAAAAELEASKSFMKEVAIAVGAPTAAYRRFTEADAAKSYLKTRSAPYVIKADGLAAGKGVAIAQTLGDAEDAIHSILGGSLGPAGNEIVIEDYLDGEEASFFVICDGAVAVPLIGVQDHKRAHDGDKGPNTGGMGAYAPAPVFTDEVKRRTMTKIINPVIAEMARRGAPFKGVLFAGLMIKNEEPQLIEFNVRFGDPECQVMMRLLKSDILPILYDAACGKLNAVEPEWSRDACALIVLAAKGYPGDYEKGSKISGVERAEKKDGVVVFHAGTRVQNGALVANGGRVLNVTACGPSIRDAVERAYAGVKEIDWPQGFYRNDIAWRALKDLI